MSALPMGSRKRIAIVGGGVAGITSAFLLQDRHDASLFEASLRLGGHTNTYVIEDGPDRGTPVDTGFIVCNDRTYPLFHRLLARLGVRVRWSDMSFGFSCEESGDEYAGTGLSGLFGKRANFVRPRHYRFLLGIREFCRVALADLNNGALNGLSLGQFLEARKIEQQVVDDYVLPMGAAIWSTPPAGMLVFPAQSFLTFLRNHGLLSLQDRPRWQTVEGGSSEYLRAFERQFRGALSVGNPVTSVTRNSTHVRLVCADQQERLFDHVILATHADQSLALLQDADEVERDILGAWKYLANDTILHTDDRVMPTNRRVWASWNFRRSPGSESSQRLTVTYHMNRLQGLRTERQYFVTLNPVRPIDERKIVAKFLYHHPHFDFPALRSQERLQELCGRNRISVCGSYGGFGFHEDAVRSAVRACEQFGGEL